MEKSKLATSLSRLSPAQWDSLMQYAGSTASGLPKDALQLLQLLRERAGTAGALSKEEAFRAVYPRAPFNLQQINQAMSFALKAVESWMALQWQAQRPALQHWQRAEALLGAGLPKHFRQALRQGERANARQKDGAWKRHLDFLLADLRERAFQQENTRRPDPALQQASDALDEHYALQKLKYVCAMLNREKLMQEQFEYHLPSFVLHGAGFHSPLIGLYRNLYHILSGEEGHEARFREYLQLYRAAESQIGRSESRALLYYAINYCIGQIRDGQRAWALPLFELYENGLKRGLLVEGGLLSPWTYKNMVKIGLNLKRFGWVESFVRAYSKMLPEAEKEDALHYNLAELYFFQARYDDALQQLHRVEFTDIHYNLGSRALLAKIYYEQQQSDPLEAALRAFLVFLRRQSKIPVAVREPYKNFARILLRALKSLPEHLPLLEKEVQSLPSLNNRDWILQKLRGKQV